MRKKIFCALAVPAIVFTLAGCKAKESPPAPSGPVAAATGGPAGTIDPACTAWQDHADPNGDYPAIAWEPAVAKSPTRCIKIKAGMTVTWAGNFKKYPLKAARGNAPTPVAGAEANISNPGVPNEERTIAIFDKPGTYGFANPTDPTMKGAVLVVP